MDLSLQFEDNDTGHRDLVLQFAGRQWRCDSYYLAIDWGMLPDQEDADKVRAVLRQLLEQWLAAVEQLPDGGTVYLPYDFSDQCTGWLCCCRSGDEVDVSWGWADVEGYALSPSAAGDLFERPSGFQADGAGVKTSAAELVQAVRAMIV